MRILISFLFVLQFSGYSFAQPPRNWSTSEIQLGLRKLGTVGSVLYIAAHPDDENTRLLSYLANDLCLRAAYLSVTRGDGGQNLIGKEQGELLGMIRTQELLAARRTDGAEQFFTRANDFGFSKNPEETFSFWNHDSVLADVVWVIRNFNPDVIITRFATDGSGGHGHHTASAILAEEAFDAAADPTRFPEQLQYTKPWKTNRLLYNSTFRFSNPNADLSSLLKTDVGGFNILLGKSYGELSAESRSMHKSQGFGTAKARGSYLEYFKPLKGDTVIKEPFQSLDFSWKKTEGGEAVQKLIDKISAAFDAQHPEASVDALVKLYDALQGIQDVSLRERKQKETLDLILACSGTVLEALTNAYSTSPGDTVKVTASIVTRSGIKIIPLSVTVQGNTIGNSPDSAFSIPLLLNKPLVAEKVITIPADAPVTNPYWLDHPHSKGIYAVADQLMIGKPENEAAFSAVFKLNIASHEFLVTRPLQFKWVEPSDGERYRPFLVAPPVMVRFSDESVVFPSSVDKNISLHLKAGRDNLSGTVQLNLPSSWTVAPKQVSFSLARKGEEQEVVFHITTPATASEAVASAVITLQGSEKTYSRGLVELKYDHIPVQTYFPQATCRFLRLDVKKHLNNIGYIAGAGDEIPKYLEQLGYRVTLLDDKMLGETKLDGLDAIVTGIRAFNTNEKLILHKQTLMNYVRNGGNLIVQYNTNNFLGPMNADIGPYPFKISRDRVTHEEAAVTFELPNHPLLNTPNKITQKDFEGWIQERGIYFANSWDSAYAVPFSMNDPGEKPMKGSTLVAQFGKGYFIYSGLVFFRELPAGVPGAFRLFVNMIECGK